MRLQAWKKAFGVMVMLLALAGLANAVGENRITLRPDKAGQGASGEVVIRDKGMDQKEVTISLKGLKPESVYTVWFVNMKPKMDMTGVGTGDYSFKTDDKGNKQYTATVSKEEFEKWQMIEVAYHPDNDPKNMKTMDIALKADIK